MAMWTSNSGRVALVSVFCFVLGAVNGLSSTAGCQKDEGTCPDGASLGLTDAGITPTGKPIMFAPGAKTLYVDETHLANFTSKGQQIFRGPDYFKNTQVKVDKASSTFMLTFWMKQEYTTGANCDRELGCRWGRWGPYVPIFAVDEQSSTICRDPPKIRDLSKGGTVFFISHGNLRYHFASRGRISIDDNSKITFPEPGRWHYYAILSTPTGGSLWIDGLFVQSLSPSNGAPVINHQYLHLCKSNILPGGVGSRFANFEYHSDPAEITKVEGQGLPPLAQVPGYAIYSSDPQHSCKFPGALYYTDLHRGSCFTMNAKSQALCVKMESSKSRICTKAMIVGHPGGWLARFANTAPKRRSTWETYNLLYHTLIHKVVRCTSRNHTGASTLEDDLLANELGENVATGSDENDESCSETKDVRCYLCTHKGYARTDRVHTTNPVQYSNRNCLGDPQKHATCASVYNSPNLNLAKYADPQYMWTANNSAWKTRAKEWMEVAANMAFTD